MNAGLMFFFMIALPMGVVLVGALVMPWFLRFYDWYYDWVMGGK
jgi:hypothetical protein